MLTKNRQYTLLHRDYASISSRRNTNSYYPEEYLGTYSSNVADNSYLNKFSSPSSNVDIRNSSLLVFIKVYFAIRLRQIVISFSLLSRLFFMIIIDLKTRLVRNMYWGRTSFYKSAFHIVVIIITMFAFSTGLNARILLPQRDSLQTTNASVGLALDSDLEYQQGSFFPADQLNGNFDSLYEDYTVVSGDTVSSIAAEYGLTQDTIRWANSFTGSRNDLQPGQILKLPRVNGVLYLAKEGDTVDSVLKKVQLSGEEEANKFDFLEINSRAGAIAEGERLVAGKTVLIPEAKIPEPRPTARSNTRAATPRVIINTDAPPPDVGNNTFVNPMQQSGKYRFSRGYRIGHTGVDLAVPRGSIIVAAGSGRVERAGACIGGLGFCVVIRHSGGFSTLYAHGNGVMYVTPGQNVLAGQRIMQSGCTGYCFGDHLHLSLAANNNDVYTCYTCRINPRGIIPY